MLNYICTVRNVDLYVLWSILYIFPSMLMSRVRGGKGAERCFRGGSSVPLGTDGLLWSSRTTIQRGSRSRTRPHHRIHPRRALRLQRRPTARTCTGRTPGGGVLPPTSHLSSRQPLERPPKSSGPARSQRVQPVTDNRRPTGTAACTRGPQAKNSPGTQRACCQPAAARPCR